MCLDINECSRWVTGALSAGWALTTVFEALDEKKSLVDDGSLVGIVSFTAEVARPEDIQADPTDSHSGGDGGSSAGVRTLTAVCASLTP